MEKKNKLITNIILGSVLTLMTGYFIYEACVPENASLAYKMTHIKLPQTINDGKVKDLRINESSIVQTPSNEIHKIDYQIIPFDAGNQDVTITSSNPDLIQIVEDGYKVLYNERNTVDYSKPVEITVASKENPEIKDILNVKVDYVPCNFLDCNESLGLYEETSNGRVRTYNFETNKIFKAEFFGFEDATVSSRLTTEKIVIKYSDNITRISQNQYYINKNDGKDCYIKAMTMHNQLTLKFNVSEGTPIALPTSFKTVEIGSLNEIDNDLNVGKSYRIIPYLNEEKLEFLPFNISSDNNKFEFIDNDTFKVNDECTLDLKIQVANNEPIIKQYNVSHTFNGFSVWPINDQTLEENKIIIFENHSFKFGINNNDSTYKDLKFEIPKECDIIEEKDGYFYALKPGETTITIKPADDKYNQEFNVTYNVEVKPIITTLTINENIWFSFLYLAYGILIGVFLFIFIMNKKYLLFMPIAYGIGLGLLTIITLTQLASPFRYPTIGLFGLFSLMIVIGISLIYIGVSIYHSYNGYDLKDK